MLKKYKEGSVTFSSANDVLTAVIGPEHSGSVRALGKGAIPTSYFNIHQRSTRDDIVRILLEEQRSLFEKERKDRCEERQVYSWLHCRRNLCLTKLPKLKIVLKFLYRFLRSLVTLHKIMARIPKLLRKRKLTTLRLFFFDIQQ